MTNSKISSIKLIFCAVLFATLFISFSSNPPIGRSGAPGDGLCSDCHTGSNPLGFDGGITIQNFPSSIVGGQTYQLSATVSNPNGLANLAGFQAVVLDNNDNNIGDLIVSGTNPITDTNTNGREYVEHNPAQPFSASNDVVWNFDWVAPTGANGTPITLYAAGNIASDSNGNQDDFIVTTTATGTLMGNPALGITVNLDQNVSCFQGNDGIATAVPSGGTPGYTYNWSNGESAPTAMLLTAGTFTVTVTDTALDTVVGTVTITEPQELDLQVISITDIDCNNSTGEATLGAFGGTSPYSYNWPSGNTLPTEPGLTAGTYSITVADSKGCIDDVFFNVLDNSTPPFVNAGPDMALDCGTAQVALNGSNSDSGPQITYLWSTSNGNIVSGDQTLMPIVDTAGTYTLMVTDVNTGCFDIDTVLVTANTSLGLTLSPMNLNCAGDSSGSIMLTVVGGTMPYSFDWDDNALDSIQNPTDLAAGTYAVTVTDMNGCEGLGSISISEPTDFTIVATPTNPSCVDTCNGSVDLLVSGGTPPYTYSWSNMETNPNISGLCAGAYFCTITDFNLCDTIISVDIAIPSGIVVTGIVTNENCSGFCDGTIALSPSGGTGSYIYNWDIDPTNTSNVLIACPGVYTATITDSNGCSTEYIEEIMGTDSLLLAETIIDATCFGECDGSILINSTGGSGNINYLWSNQSDSSYISDLCAGTYTVTASDENGCQTVETFAIGETQEIVISEIITEAGCFGECNGQIFVNVTGGDGNYNYNWENIPTSNNFIDNLCAGIYALTVTDGNGCESIGVYNVTENAPIIASISSTNETSNGANDGTAFVTVNGLATDHSFLWSNAGTTDTIVGLVPGSYSVTVTNNLNGCIDSSSVVVNVANCNLTTTISGTSVSCSGDTDGTAAVQASNGTMPYMYSWSSGGNGSTETGLSAGIVFCTVTDMIGCSEVLSFEITSPEVLTGTATVVNSSCSNTCDGSISLDLFGGTQPYFIVPNSLNSLCPGIYDIEVTDAKGCVFNITSTVGAPSGIDPNINSTPVTTVGGSDGTVTTLATGGTSPYSYSWNNGASTDSLSNLIEGTYCVTITDINNCSVDTCIVVGPPGCQLTLSLQLDQPSCAGENNGSATATTSGGTPPYTYSWSSSSNTTNVETNLQAGVYTVTVSDTAGCDAVQTFEILDGPDLAISIVNIGSTSCNGGCDGLVELASPNYTFTWPDNTIAFQRQDLCAGSYVVTATDGTCTDSIVVVITEPAPISLFMSSSDETTAGAADGTASAFPTGSTGNFSFVWNNGEISQTLDSLSAGTYCVTVTSDSGCQESDCVLVNLTGCDLVVSLNQNVSTCFEICDGELTASITGGTSPYTINWSNGASSTDTLSDLCAGSYTITVVDTNGCVAEATSTIVEYSEIAVSADLMNWNVDCNLPCDNGSIFLNVTGTAPFTYDWSLDTLDGSNGGTGLCPGIYSCTITDGNGCEFIYTSPDVANTDPLLLAVNVFDACFGTCDGQVAFTIAGGTPPYQIATNLPSNFSQVCPGDYFISATDDNGCETIDSFTVAESLELSVTTDEIGNASSADDGFINITPNGTGPFVFSWSINGNIISTLEDLQDLAAGTYLLVITDVNGCELQQTFEVLESVSTNNILSLENISIFPNPAREFFNVNISLTQSANINIILFDVLGQNVFELKNWKGLELQEVINTSGFSSGVYTLLIQSNDEYWTEKLVILNN